MEKILVQGPTTLQGTVAISGAKNAALPLLASSLLANGTYTFKNVPALDDIGTMLKLLQPMGVRSHFSDDRHTVHITTQNIEHPEALGPLVKAIRASILLLGPLVARHGRAALALPGGDAIGARPVEQHLRGLQALGAHISMEQDTIYARAKRLHGAKIQLDMPTVTGTENLMMAAALAKGTTLLQNAAREPEIEDLAQALNQMGASIRGAGTSLIQIEGVDELRPIEYTVMPDRIEAGTFLVAAALCQGEVRIQHCRPDQMEAVLQILRQIGADIQLGDSWMRCKGKSKILPFDLVTEPYPAFPTDLQAQFLTLACLAQGTSTVTETIFENRYMHVPELMKMGANILVRGRVATIQGVPHFHPASVKGADLRASASLVLAGLAARGETVITGIDHLDRGYEQFETKLRGLGAKISREV